MSDTLCAENIQSLRRRLLGESVGSLPPLDCAAFGEFLTWNELLAENIRDSIRRLERIAAAGAERLGKIKRSAVQVEELPEWPHQGFFGPSGSGKDLLMRHFAKAIQYLLKDHRLITQTGNPLHIMQVHGTSDPAFALKHLFGRRSGKQAEKGHAEIAGDMGQILAIDEFAKIPLSSQENLLRFIQTGEFEPLESSSRSICKSICLFLATATETGGIDRLVKDNVLLKDMFRRIRRPAVVLPPLSDRPEDLWGHTHNALSGLEPITWEEDAILAWTLYEWAGDVGYLLTTLADLLDYVQERGGTRKIVDSVTLQRVSPEIVAQYNERRAITINQKNNVERSNPHVAQSFIAGEDPILHLHMRLAEIEKRISEFERIVSKVMISTSPHTLIQYENEDDFFRALETGEISFRKHIRGHGRIKQTHKSWLAEYVTEKGCTCGDIRTMLNDGAEFKDADIRHAIRRGKQDTANREKPVTSQ